MALTVEWVTAATKIHYPLLSGTLLRDSLASGFSWYAFALNHLCFQVKEERRAWEEGWGWGAERKDGHRVWCPSLM